MEDFAQQVAKLKADLVQQGRRVQRSLEAAFEAVFARDLGKAHDAIALDEEIDQLDVRIEKSCVSLLTEATAIGNRLEPHQLRLVLMIVKVNNELERIADVGVAIAEECRLFHASGGDLPQTFRVLANSSIGIVRDTTTSLERVDPDAARKVLQSEEIVVAFKKALVAEVQRQVSTGAMKLDTSSALHDVAMQCVSIADHCTNIAEQVMYTASGRIVRHMHGHWQDVQITDQRS